MPAVVVHSAKLTLAPCRAGVVEECRLIVTVKRVFAVAVCNGCCGHFCFSFSGFRFCSCLCGSRGRGETNSPERAAYSLFPPLDPLRLLWEVLRGVWVLSLYFAPVAKEENGGGGCGLILRIRSNLLRIANFSKCLRYYEIF